MIALMDTPQDLATCAAELGMECGQLLTPLTRRANRGGMFGIDNGAFSRFNAKAFLSLVERNTQHRTRCVFVAMPDIVANARRTLELFDYWAPRFDGWPVALVAQDGPGAAARDPRRSPRRQESDGPSMNTEPCPHCKRCRRVKLRSR